MSIARSVNGVRVSRGFHGTKVLSGWWMVFYRTRWGGVVNDSLVDNGYRGKQKGGQRVQVLSLLYDVLIGQLGWRTGVSAGYVCEMQF